VYLSPLSQPAVPLVSSVNKFAVKAIVSLEKRIIDSTLDDAGVLHARDAPDETHRNSYAMYLYGAVRSAGVEGVHIVDIASVTRDRSPLDWEIIGERWSDRKGG
jgi:hypothetical protein